MTENEFNEYFMSQVSANIDNILDYDKYREFYTNEFEKMMKIC